MRKRRMHDSDPQAGGRKLRDGQARAHRPFDKIASLLGFSHKVRPSRMLEIVLE
jgi:hypothetical protein